MDSRELVHCLQEVDGVGDRERAVNLACDSKGVNVWANIILKARIKTIVYYGGLYSIIRPKVHSLFSLLFVTH